MDNLHNFYIDGAWVAPQSDHVFPVMNPATEEQVGEIILGNTEDVNRAVAAAKKAFVTFSRTTQAERLHLLEQLLEATQDRLDDLAQAISTEMGAPITMAYEAQAGAAVVSGYIEALTTLQERTMLANGDTQLREPIGVCGLITPWNWPINQIALKVIPALATGCTCILKPSEHTPISDQGGTYAP